MKVNGKEYSLWGQFIERKDEWIGGTLTEQDPHFGVAETTITDITLEPNGKESAFFTIVGEEFSCGFDVRYGGVSGRNEPQAGTIHFGTTFGSNFMIDAATE